MEEEISRKLTKKERQIIENIERKAARRKHKPEFTVNFLLNYLFDHDTIKEWDYKSREDVLDMIESLLEIARKCNFLTEKQIQKERKSMIQEYADEYFPKEEDS